MCTIVGKGLVRAEDADCDRPGVEEAELESISLELLILCGSAAVMLLQS